ncbi:hypothetical protein GJ496_010690 [Pomphorhynchus laevis]|nr:hypothetical protein GJ496_010690 [Pomphorhynchus laevis]
MSGLKHLVSNRIINEILRCDTVKRQSKTDWKVLVMDQLATQIISSSCKMHDIMAEGITIVEDIFKSREPLHHLEAVYFISPTNQAIDRLIDDFEHHKDPLYAAAHIFFTRACDSDNFDKLSKSKIAKFTKTIKEINVAFIPYERQVFTLGFIDGLNIVYNPSLNQTRVVYLEAIAEQIATLCATLQEYPQIRYRSEFIRNTEFAHILQSKLDQYKAEDPSMGEGAEKSKSILLIVDRSFDPVTPVIHDLTLYSTDTSNSGANISAALSANQKEVILTDSNDLWPEIRHKHIASASQ